MVENLLRDLNLVGNVGFLCQKKLVEYFVNNLGLAFDSGLLDDSIKDAHLRRAIELGES